MSSTSKQLTFIAAILETGSVVTWVRPEYGGDSSRAQGQLRNVQHIQASSGAFVAILQSGAVVTCGDPRYGGDSSQVREQLSLKLEGALEGLNAPTVTTYLMQGSLKDLHFATI